MSPPVGYRCGGRNRKDGEFRRRCFCLQRESNADDPGQADVSGELSSVLDSLRKRTSQPYGRSLRRFRPPGQCRQAAYREEQPHRAIRRQAGQLRNHLYHAQPAALGEALGQTVPGDLQPGQPYRRRQDRREAVVPAHRPRCAPRGPSDPSVSLRSGQEAQLALRRPHADKQPGDLFRVRPRHGQDRWEPTIRSGTTKRGSGSTSMGA